MRELPTDSSLNLEANKWQIRLAQGSRLLRKVASELANPKQFFQPGRAAALLRNGRASLSSITHELSLSILDAQELVSRSLDWVRLPNAEIGATDVGMAAVIFPKGARVGYRHPDRVDKLPEKFIASLRGTTETEVPPLKNSPYSYPSEGYKDSRGVIVPFQKRRQKDWVQHGGIWIDNSTGSLKLLDYLTLLEAREQNLSYRQVLVEANWYMDSGNQVEVAGRENLLCPNFHNLIGVTFDRRGRRRLFTLSSYPLNYFGLQRKAGKNLIKANEVNAPIIAALSNFICERVGADSWQVAGLEYIGGGTSFDKRNIDRYRDYLLIYS